MCEVLVVVGCLKVGCRKNGQMSLGLIVGHALPYKTTYVAREQGKLRALPISILLPYSTNSDGICRPCISAEVTRLHLLLPNTAYVTSDLTGQTREYPSNG